MKIMEYMGNMALSGAESACQFNIGQFFIRLLDRSIGIIERTAQWSLPSNEIVAEENGKSFSDMKLVRPLPWILFLPGLVILRGFRFTWNVGAFFLGYDAIHPGDIVASLQRVRRRLRTIRMNGIRRMRKIKPTNSRDQSLGLNGSKRSLLRSIQLTLSTLSCFDASKMKSSPPPVRIRVPMNYDTTPALVEKPTESTTMTQQYEAKRKHSQVSSDDPLSEEESETDEMTVAEKLKHYADLNSSDDPDFNSPNCTAETDDLEKSNGEEEEYEEEDLHLLVAEARESLIASYRETNPEMSEEEVAAAIDEKLRPVHNITTNNGNGNCVAKNVPDDIKNYHSPCKSIEDTDTAFYSPISSKSTSPERDLATDIAVGIVHDSTNARLNPSKRSTIIMEEETEIDHDENYEHVTEKNEVRIELPCAKGKQQRDNNKGKRSTHGNRKKKL